MPISQKKKNKVKLNPDNFNSYDEFRKAYHQEYHKLNCKTKTYKVKRKKYNKFYKLSRTYNINIQEYKKLMNLANYSCEICGIKNKDHKNKYNLPLYIDHDHKTGNIRGILCSQCNFIEGLLDKLNIDIDQFYSNYLDYFNKKSPYIKSLNIWRKNDRSNKVVKFFRRYKKNAT